MTKRYTSRDPIINGDYTITKDSAQRLVLTPKNTINALLKGKVYSFPFESFDRFTERIGLTPA